MKLAFVVAVGAAMLITGSSTAAADNQTGYAFPFTCDSASLTADFAQRDAAPHTETPPSDWYRQQNGRFLNGGWGPAAAALPGVAVPADAGCDAATWKRERIVSAALHYVNVPDNPQGLQYRHHHIPDWDPPTATGPAGADSSDMDGQSPETWGPGRGLDCSNFTAWVYNYGLGIKFGGDVGKQYAGTAGPMGQQLPADGPFEPGDLLFLHPNHSAGHASHVVIFLDDQHIIDSRLNAQGIPGVQIRQRDGWYRTAVLGGWRPILG